MASFGKVVGGHFINATVTTNWKGDLALSLGFKRTPNLTAEAVSSWEEIVGEERGGAAGAFGKMGQAVARAALPGAAGKAASAAVDSAVDSIRGAPHMVRVDWIDGKQSLIRLPDKLFQHLTMMLKDLQIATATPAAAGAPPAAPTGMMGHIAKLAGATAAAPDVTEQIARLAALRDQGALTEEEFAAKKAELLQRM